jgi:ParB-like chromosome segregation protein Spo0J
VEQLTDLVQVLDDLPPIVVKRSKKKGQYDIIDGAHRATAALWAGRNIPAFIPVK